MLGLALKGSLFLLPVFLQNLLGADPFSAKRGATRLLDATVSRPAAVLAYDHVFALVSSLFFVGFPLVFLLRRGSEPEEVDVPAE